MLPVSEAEAIILNLVRPLHGERDAEVVTLLTAIDRILAAPVVSQLDFPHWDNSAMDGYAVRYEDVRQSSVEQPTVLQVVEEISAGRSPQHSIESGQAARILTGAVMPPGADTVVIQEQTRRDGDHVFVLDSPESQDAFVRHQASFYQAGTSLLPPGIMLQPTQLAVLAAAQCTQVKVYRRPRVAILSTGDELVTPDQPLQLGQIVDSNQYALAALVAQTGAEPLRLDIVRDNPKAIKRAITRAVAIADVVISSGGVSVGDHDYVEEILESLGAKIHVSAVAVKPGKPLTVATLSSSTSNPKTVLYFGVPGNPVSALVSFWRFIQPALKKLSGLTDSWGPVFVQAQTRYDLHSDGKRETYLWGQLHLVDGLYEFHLAGGNHSSGNLINLAQTNGLAVLPVGKTLISQGDFVQVLQVGLPFS